MTPAEYYADTIAHRELPDGRELVVIPLTFGRARLCLSPRALSLWYDDGW